MTAIVLAMPMGTSPFAASGQSIGDEQRPYVSNMSLDSTSANVIRSGDILSNIQPGESSHDRETRLRLEAEARDREEAMRIAQEEAERKAREQQELAKRSVVSRENRNMGSRANASQSVDLAALYRRAGGAYNVDPRLLEAVHYVETGRSVYIEKRSIKGATGPMQFMPGTWKRNGVDGNGDGIADIMNVEDAVFAAARYLSICVYPNVRKALWSYNPSYSYYYKVMEVAKSLGM